jgi:hypothetical protein
MARVTGRRKRQGAAGAAAGAALVGAQGEPLSAYPGWDARAGVFRLDQSLSEIAERYRKIAGDAGDEGRDMASDDASPRAPESDQSASPPRARG